MQINSQELVLDTKGVPFKVKDADQVTEMNYAHVISDALSVSTVGGKMKMYSLIKAFAAGGMVQVDESDMVLIKKSLEGYNGYNNVVMGQILLALEK
jgi:hypothetical protein